MRIATRTRGRCFPARVIICLLLIAAGLSAQSGPTERKLPVSKAQLDKALRQLPAYPGGKLPILDGFVSSDKVQSLDHYKRAYYEYALQAKAAGSNQVEVRVSAKITAWFAGDNPAHSGYRVLPSNGRLESDLFDRLEEALNLKSATTENQGDSSNALPDAPGTSSRASSPFSALPSSLPSHGQPKQLTARDERRVEQLRNEKKNLEEILQQQTRPDNLASVRSSQTPVLSQPIDGAQQIMLADADDEFQVLGRAGEWVHVQISGLSRGWVKASLLDLPPTARAVPSNDLSAAIDDQTFTQTKQETSTFPGDWEPLRGKKVRIIWVKAGEARDPDGQAHRLDVAKSVFQKTYPELSHDASGLAGLVVVFDAQDGGMAAVTLATLEQWNAGHLTDKALWKRCWFDPADAFGMKE